MLILFGIVAGISLVGLTTLGHLFDDADVFRFANEESLEEIYRVLVPGGTLGMIWNIEDCLIAQTNYSMACSR